MTIKKEEKEEGNFKEVDYEKLVKEIENGVNKNIDMKLGEGLDRLENKIEAKLEKKDNDDFLFSNHGDENGEDEVPITKKELRSILAVEREKMQKEVLEKSEKTAIRLLDKKTNKQIQASGALRRFPQLNQDNPLFNKKFSEEVSNEINKRLAGGRSTDDADLLLDAASAVKLSWIDRGVWRDKTKAEAEALRLNNQEDNFSFSPSKNGRVGALTDSHYEAAAKYGMNRERFKELYDKYGKR